MTALFALILCVPVPLPFPAAPPPPVSAHRFPQTPWVAQELAAFADEHVRWLESHGHRVMVPVPRFFWTEEVPVETDWLVEARWRRDCWQALRQAKEGTNVADSLGRLRSLIGDADYAMGLMPAPVPAARFRVRERGEK